MKLKTVSLTVLILVVFLGVGSMEEQLSINSGESSILRGNKVAAQNAGVADDSGSNSDAEEDYDIPVARPEASKISLMASDDELLVTVRDDRLIAYTLESPDGIPELLGRSESLGMTIDSIVIKNRVAYISGEAYSADKLTAGGSPKLEQSIVAVDVSDLENLQVLAIVPAPGGALDMQIKDDILWTAAGEEGIRVFDISSGMPVDLGSRALGGYVNSLDVGPDYVAALAHDPDAMFARIEATIGSSSDSNVSTQGGASGNASDAIEPPKMYVLPGGIASVTDMGATIEYELRVEGTNVALGLGTAYVASDQGVEIVDLQDPAQPQYAGFYRSLGKPKDLVSFGTHLILAEQDINDFRDTIGASSLDVSQPNLPQSVSSLRMRHGARAMTVVGSIAYVAAADGFYVIDVSDPSELQEIAGPEQTRSWWGNVAVVGDNMLVADRYQGLTNYDISNPAVPVKRQTWLFDVGAELIVADPVIEVRDDVIYLTAANRLFTYLMFDGIIEPLGRSEIYYPFDPQASNISVEGDYAYISTYWDGVIIMDISDPILPEFAGHYPVVSPDGVEVDGNFAYVAAHSGLHTVDVSNVVSPTMVSVLKVPALRSMVRHADMLYVGSAWKGVERFDISTAGQPTHVDTYPLDGDPRSLAVENGKLMVGQAHKGPDISQIRADGSLSSIIQLDAPDYLISVDWDGDTAAGVRGNMLTIFDMTDPAQPQVVAEQDATG